MTEILIKPAGRDKPGYLRRVQKRMAIEQRMSAGDPSAVDDMLNFVIESADSIDAPDGVDVKEALLDLSKEEFEAVFRAAGGADEVDPQSGA